MIFGARAAPAWLTRKLAPQDSAACAALHEASFPHGWSPETFESLILDPATIADALTTERRLAGFALSRLALDEAEILSIALLPAQRGRGLGANLLRAHLERLRLARAARVFLEVDEANAPARALYDSLGFSTVGRRSNYYSLPGGARAHALVLRRDL